MQCNHVRVKRWKIKFKKNLKIKDKMCQINLLRVKFPKNKKVEVKSVINI